MCDDLNAEQRRNTLGAMTSEEVRHVIGNEAADEQAKLANREFEAF